ncbi:MAG: twin-arginine translocation signal domain-containing protein, partial [Phycisphaerales bacterium]
MGTGRCPHHCHGCHSFSRRHFLKGSTVVLAGSSLLAGCSSLRLSKNPGEPIRPCGPASTCVPTIRAAFVRRQ